MVAVSVLIAALLGAAVHWFLSHIQSPGFVIIFGMLLIFGAALMLGPPLIVR